MAVTTRPPTVGPRAGSAVPGGRALLARLWARQAFRRLYLTRLAGQFADGVFEGSLAGFVLFNPERATTAGQLAGAAAVLLLPYSLVGPAAGIVIDRVNRRQVLRVANLVRALAVVPVALVAFGGYEGAGFFALALVVFGVNRFVLSALSAALPVTVPAAELIPTNALSATSGTAVTVLGALVGGGIATVAGGGDTGAGTSAASAVLLYVLASLVAGRLPHRLLDPPPAATRSSWQAELSRAYRDVADGARHIWSRPPARNALGVITAHRFCYGLATVATILAYRNLFPHAGGVFRGGGAGLGELVAATAVGTVLAALTTTPAARRLSAPRWVAVNLAVAAAAELVLGLPYRPAPFVAAGLVLGFVSQAVKICVDTLVQRHIDDSFRGRAFSFYDQLFNVAYVAAAALAAAVLPVDGKSAPLVVAVAVGYGLTAGWYLLVTRRAGKGHALGPTDAAEQPPRPRPTGLPPSVA